MYNQIFMMNIMNSNDRSISALSTISTFIKRIIFNYLVTLQVDVKNIMLIRI